MLAGQIPGRDVARSLNFSSNVQRFTRGGRHEQEVRGFVLLLGATWFKTEPPLGFELCMN